MISNEKMEEYWYRYRSEGVAKGLSLQGFCTAHNIPYNAFEKYLKMRRHFSTVYPLKIIDKPAQESARPNPAEEAAPTTRSIRTDATNGETRISVDIRTDRGMQIRQRNISYGRLKDLVEKLEALC